MLKDKRKFNGYSTKYLIKHPFVGLPLREMDLECDKKQTQIDQNKTSACFAQLASFAHAINLPEHIAN